MAICCDEHGEVEGYANIEAGNRDVANEASDDDAALIANAPADLAYLLAEVARLRERVAVMEATLARGRKFINQTIEAVTPSCPCDPDEFCGECLAIKTLEQVVEVLDWQEQGGAA